MSLILNVVQNFFNIAASFKKQIISSMCLEPNDCFNLTTYEDDKNYFNMAEKEFPTLIDRLSIVQCIMAGIIVFEFLCRKTPAIFMQIREELDEQNFSSTRRKYIFVKEFFLRTFFNFEIVYYLCYITFAILGYIANDFFFAFLLLEVITRFKTLRNVVMAIRNPIKELFLTLILWVILIYYFAIVAYAFFREDFPDLSDCESLAKCTATIFYQNNRNDNGIGSYLKPITTNDVFRNPVVGRFWYDQLFNLLIKILIIQMLAGIIIDNFTKLRKGEMEMLSDMKNVCTTCGMKRDDIEKIYDKYSKTYDDHIRNDHGIFNYIYYIIFLHKKDKTEFTGMESYVYDLAFKQKDITWFPIDK
jgi:hypothetical protein